MSSILIVLPKIEDAKHIRDILSRRGLTTAALCTTASTALANVHQLDSGVVICSYRVSDMHYSQLAAYLPDYFDMLLLTSAAEAGNCPEGVVSLTYPIRPPDLVSTVEMMLAQLERRRQKLAFLQNSLDHTEPHTGRFDSATGDRLVLEGAVMRESAMVQWLEHCIETLEHCKSEE